MLYTSCKPSVANITVPPLEEGLNLPHIHPLWGWHHLFFVVDHLDEEGSTRQGGRGDELGFLTTVHVTPTGVCDVSIEGYELTQLMRRIRNNFEFFALGTAAKHTRAGGPAARSSPSAISAIWPEFPCSVCHLTQAPFYLLLIYSYYLLLT
jgi:hypothetical protein